MVAAAPWAVLARRPAELGAPHGLRPRGREGRAQPLDLVVASGARVARLLRDGPEVGRVSGGGESGDREHGEREPEVPEHGAEL